MLNPRSSKDRAYTSPIWELYFLNDAKGYIRAAAVDANGDRFDEGDIFFVGRWGESNDKAAIYDYQGSAALLFHQPFDWFGSDAIGVQYNYIDPASAGSRTKESFELFYRFPLLPDV